VKCPHCGQTVYLTKKPLAVKVEKGPSAAELKVIELTRQGFSNGDISKELGLTLRTIKGYRNRLFKKYKITSKDVIKSVVLVNRLREEEEQRKTELAFSEKQLQVMDCIAQGYSNNAIARDTGLSIHIIKNYLREIFEAVGCWNRIELANWFVCHRDSLVENLKKETYQ